MKMKYEWKMNLICHYLITLLVIINCILCYVFCADLTPKIAFIAGAVYVVYIAIEIYIDIAHFNKYSYDAIYSKSEIFINFIIFLAINILLIYWIYEYKGLMESIIFGVVVILESVVLILLYFLLTQKSRKILKKRKK